VCFQRKMLTGIELRYDERPRPHRLRVLATCDGVRWKREFGRQVWVRGCSFNHHRISNRNDLPIGIGGAKGCGNGICVEWSSITESDTAPQGNAPALIARLRLPGSCQQRLRMAAIVEPDQGFEDERSQLGSGGSICGIECARCLPHCDSQSSAIARPRSCEC